MEAIKGFLQYPYDPKIQRTLASVVNIEEAIVEGHSSIIDYERALESLRKQIHAQEAKLVLAKKNAEGIKVITSAEALEVVRKLSKVAWIESIRVGAANIIVKTRPGMLKTILDVRLVDSGRGRSQVEFIDPVTVSLPQYEIGIGVNYVGQGRMANNSSALNIKMVNDKDVSKFVAGKVVRHEPRAHWAAQSAGLGTFGGLCLGEYEEEINEAMKVGIVEAFVAVAHYLQTSGDEHAYDRKHFWAAKMGNPEYADFCVREIGEGETPEGIAEKYKRDFKLMRQPDMTKARGPEPIAIDGDIMQRNRLDGIFTRTFHENFFRNNGLFFQGSVVAPRVRRPNRRTRRARLQATALEGGISQTVEMNAVTGRWSVTDAST